VPETYRVGADENGLGARLGPLVVTAVGACVDERGEKALRRKLPKKLAALVGDSKALVKHGDVALGEAWARVLVGTDVTTPSALFTRLSLEGEPRLRERCPDHVGHQCWSVDGEAFVADDELMERVLRVRTGLADRGIQLDCVKSSVICTDRLNRERARGENRFTSDLHAMEELVMAFRNQRGHDLFAVCGKVGGMGDYSRFFGPLAGWLHVELLQTRRESAYRFPGLGELRFLQDADSRDVLVMLASLVGKYLRELLMARVAHFYLETVAGEEFESPSGYSDPVTNRFVEATALVREKRRVPDTCFVRARDGAGDG
jgi:ribonuclease HII